MLLEMGIADAYGAAFEFVENIDEKGLVNDGVTFQKHPDFDIGNGRYTDDTQMAISIAEELLSGDPSFSAEHLARRFVINYKRDPRLGYGRRFYALMNEVETGEELLAKLEPTSTRSGGAMRVAPVGLLPTTHEVLAMAALQASVTHNSPEGIMASRAIAAAVHFFVWTGFPEEDLGEWLEEKVPGHAWSADWNEPASVQGIPCAHAAITMFRQGTSYVDIMKRAVANGGDTDTVAAMAVAIASVSGTKVNDFTDAHFDNFEGGRGKDGKAWGYSFLRQMDGELMALVERLKTRP